MKQNVATYMAFANSIHVIAEPNLKSTFCTQRWKILLWRNHYSANAATPELRPKSAHFINRTAPIPPTTKSAKCINTLDHHLTYNIYLLALI